MKKILVVEDDKYFRFNLVSQLQEYGQIVEAQNLQVALHMLKTQNISFVFSDLDLSENERLEGIEVIKKANEKNITSIALSGNDSKDIIKAAYKAGCDHYFVKQDFLENLKEHVGGILNSMDEDEFRSFFATKYITNDEELISKISYLRDLPRPREHKILITGPTGVGKTKIAKALHELSTDAGDFVHVNLSELSENLIESELFGHVKGAFTGATSDKEGLLSRANGGTLFLDEIGTIPIHIQKKLLKAIEEKSFSKVGSTDVETSDFRLITATCDDLQRLIKEEKFRLDFFFRINGFELKIKSLKERREDITLLFDHFLSNSSKKIILDDEVEEILNKYDWPGNIRELENLVLTISAGKKGLITLSDLPRYILNNENNESKIDNNLNFVTEEMIEFARNNGLQSLIKLIETNIYESTLNECEGKINKVARELQLSKSLLYRIQSDAKNSSILQ